MLWKIVFFFQAVIFHIYAETIQSCEQPDNYGKNYCSERRATCVNQSGGFLCKCTGKDEYVDNKNGSFACVAAEDPCRRKNKCTGIAKCKKESVELGYICQCPYGFAQATNPKTGDEYCQKYLRPCKQNRDCFEELTFCNITEGFCQKDLNYKLAITESPHHVKGGCRPGVCKWNRECYDTGYDTVDCNCRDLSASKKPKKEICMKDGDANVYYPHPIFFYNVLCQTSDDDCGYPENEADIHKARDFNYFGPCIFELDAVKCELGVKPVKRGNFIFCDYPPETRSYLGKNCTSATNVG